MLDASHIKVDWADDGYYSGVALGTAGQCARGKGQGAAPFGRGFYLIYGIHTTTARDEAERAAWMAYNASLLIDSDPARAMESAKREYAAHGGKGDAATVARNVCAEANARNAFVNVRCERHFISIRVFMLFVYLLLFLLFRNLINSTSGLAVLAAQW